HEKLVDSIPKDIYVYQDLMKDIPNRGKNLLENLSEKYKIVIPYHELFHCYPIYKLFYPLLKKIHEDILNKAYVPCTYSKETLLFHIYKSRYRVLTNPEKIEIDFTNNHVRKGKYMR